MEKASTEKMSEEENGAYSTLSTPTLSAARAQWMLCLARSLTLDPTTAMYVRLILLSGNLANVEQVGWM